MLELGIQYSENDLALDGNTMKSLFQWKVHESQLDRRRRSQDSVCISMYSTGEKVETHWKIRKY